jgi:predicted nucleic acid-binding protein
VKAYFDTTVRVAAAVAGHVHHAQSLSTLLAVRNKTVSGCVGGHGRSELYAVLTRAPSRPPIYPLEAWKLISANVLPNFRILNLTPEMYRDTIEVCANHGWIGGRICDALHLPAPGKPLANASTHSKFATFSSWRRIWPAASALLPASSGRF